MLLLSKKNIVKEFCGAQTELETGFEDFNQIFNCFPVLFSEWNTFTLCLSDYINFGGKVTLKVLIKIDNNISYPIRTQQQTPAQ